MAIFQKGPHSQLDLGRFTKRLALAAAGAEWLNDDIPFIVFSSSEEYFFFALILRSPSGLFQPGGEFFRTNP